MRQALESSITQQLQLLTRQLAGDLIRELAADPQALALLLPSSAAAQGSHDLSSGAAAAVATVEAAPGTMTIDDLCDMAERLAIEMLPKYADKFVEDMLALAAGMHPNGSHGSPPPFPFVPWTGDTSAKQRARNGGKGAKKAGEEEA